jgi:hypothetical protein
MDSDTLFQGLRDDGTYKGPSTVVFEDPTGSITGQASLRVGPETRAEAEISIDNVQIPPEYNDNLVAFLNASLAKREGERVVVPIPASGHDRRISSLTVDTETGIFTATSGILINPGFWGLSDSETISIVLNDLVLSQRTDAIAKYWLMPLNGPFAEYYRQRSAPPHVLAQNGESYIPFSVDGRACGLQIFGKEKSRKHTLATYDAIAFGEISMSADTLEGIWAALPDGLQNALSFSIGADVTAPWIEVRGEDGQLIHRFFHRVGRRSTEGGFGAFSPVNECRTDSGVGPFLNAFYSISTERRDSLLVPLNLIRSGAPGSSNIDDSITDLIKALDSICKTHGLTSQDLFNRLEKDNQQRVVTLLDEARRNLLTIRSDNASTGRQEQADVLNIIVSKVASATTRSRDFGIAVKDLLKSLRLHDAEVLDNYYQGLGQQGASWAGILSAARGEVIHNGFLRIKDRRALRSWFDFARHLDDLCKRIILREVDYHGCYQASTNPWRGEYSVDRVLPTTTVKDLGFSDVPTHI